MSWRAALLRREASIRWGSLALLVGAFVALARVLPVDRWVDALQDWVGGLGMAGPFVFGALYAGAALLFVPGAALTLAAGALFGLLWGTVIVSVASTTTVFLAFLISRHFARGKVTELARRHPRFDALDDAIATGSWKVIALLRLSPAVPFSLGNYLFGLTKIPLWTHVFTSWWAMLPGTFMYVYLGHIGRAATEGQGRTLFEWIFLGVGLAATVVVTLYVTRLAKRRLAARTRIEEEAGTRAAPGDGERTPGWGLAALAGVALLVSALALFALFEGERFRDWLGISEHNGGALP